MKILVDLTCCEKGHSYGVYAFRVLSVWREYNSSNVDIILLIKEEMEAWAKKEFPEWKYILLKQYSYRNSLQKNISNKMAFEWIIVAESCKYFGL